MANEIRAESDLAGRATPGTVTIPGREFLYVSDGRRPDFSSLFEELTTKVTPRLAQRGGVISENCRLRMPDGRAFHALSYTGDLDGGGWIFNRARSSLAWRLAVSSTVPSSRLMDEQPRCVLRCFFY
jgi:hypothetical protein